MKSIAQKVFLSLFLNIFIINQIWCQELIIKDLRDHRWWKEEIVYQIYPRSFKDSDGDGIGDLKGIISKLDYIKNLGVTAIWLNPIYESPNDDNGYDVSDYKKIMKLFGTMEDFDNLLTGLHQRGIKLIMDIVVNHSSDEHEWFKQSRSSRQNPYRNYYHWWNAEKGLPPYRYSLFDEKHNAWKFDSVTNAYYLHYFSVKQPDLNWENPQLRKEIYDIMKFWAQKGVDGFRLDAFQFAAKDTTFPMFPIGFEKNFVKYYAMQGNLHAYLQEMNKEVFSLYKVFGVAEGAGNTFEDAHNLVDENRNELNMAYAFDGVDLAKMNGYDFLKFKKIYSDWDSAFSKNGWLSIFLANHDQARMVSRFGIDTEPLREKSSQLLSTFIMTMRGTPYYFNGDELGMTNNKEGFKTISDFRDMPTLNEYKSIVGKKEEEKKFLQRIRFECRDNGRTPYQWDTTPFAGFSSQAAWINVNPNYKKINALLQEKDPLSCLNYFRKLVALRKSNPVFVYGKYTLLDKKNPFVYAYTREDEDEKVLIVLNFSKHAAAVNINIPFKKAQVLLSNYTNTKNLEKRTQKINLKPCEAVIYKLYY